MKYAGTTGTAFKDPTKGKELGLAEYNQGADIIFHASGSTGLGVFEAAREKGAGHFAIGVDADQYAEAPGFILTSMVKRVDTAVFDTIEELKASRWQGGVREFGLGEKGVGWVYDENNRALVPDAVKAKVDALEAEIAAGRIVVPTDAPPGRPSPRAPSGRMSPWAPGPIWAAACGCGRAAPTP